MPAATRLAKTRPIGSPLQAYRLDLSGRLANAPFSGNDGVWLTISELVAAHCAAGRESTAPPVLRAIELAVQHLGSDAVAKGCRHDPVDRVGASAITPIRVIAENVEHAGLLRVAAVLLDAVQAIADVDPLDRGRIAAQRARIARKLGDSEGAADRYTELEALAEDLNDDELRSRALLGRAAAAQVSGNYTETERLAAACVSLATSRGYLGLAAAARVGLVSCAAHRGDLDAALQHAWTSIGALHDNPVAEAEYTANLGRLLLDMGQTAAARAVFARAATMTVAPHIVLPALGGLALASASHDDPDTVRWAARQVLAGGARHSLLYEYAAALYECAKALTMIGDKTEASSVRERAAALAQRNGFHELRYRADDLEIEHTRARERPRVQSDSEVILRELVQSAPSELPEVLVSMGAVD